MLFVTTASASIPIGQLTISAFGTNGNELDMPFRTIWGTDGCEVWTGTEGSRFISWPPQCTGGFAGDGIPDAGPLQVSAFLNTNDSCIPEEPFPRSTLGTQNDCWSNGYRLDEPALGGAFGPNVPTAWTVGANELVFDDWEVTDAEEMQPVFEDQTDGVQGYCRTGDRGILSLGHTGLLAPLPENWVSYQSYVNPVTDVGTDAHYKAVYAPADPDTSPPVVTIDRLLDCAVFGRDATESTLGTPAVIQYSCDDPGVAAGYDGPSDVDSCVGTIDGTPVADGATIDTSVAGDFTLEVTGTDNEGNSRTRTATYHVLGDETPPTLAPSFSSSPPFVKGQAGVTLDPNASDDDSGIASESCDAVVTSTVGNHTATCSATDNAGNMASQDVTYFVKYGTGGGLLTPSSKSKWKRGVTVPIKLRLTDAQGQPIADGEAGSLASACKVVASATGAQSIPAPGCMKYDALKDEFIYTWKLAKYGSAGAASVKVTITYASGGPTTVGPLAITIS